MRAFAVGVAFSTLLLVVAGGLVTSNDASLAIPDWPLNWGTLVPPMEGGIRYAFAHRIAAAIVGLLIAILAVWLQLREARVWVRRVGWLAFATILAQAGLGGAVIQFTDPRILTIAHAALAQLCFGLVVAIAVGQFHRHPAADFPRRLPVPQILAAAAFFLQSILGAALRHGSLTLTPHIAGAIAATVIAMWAALEVLMHHMEEAPLRRAAMFLLGLTASQVFLGISAYMSRVATADAPQPMPAMVWATVAHQTTGSLVFGSAIALAMIVYWHEKPKLDLLHGGMAVA